MEGEVILLFVTLLSLSTGFSYYLDRSTNFRINDCEENIRQVRECVNDIKSMISDMRVEIVSSVSSLSERIAKLEERMDDM
jgi:uncharacterized protein Yka (UPF0111/DUF47 family)